jgi:hypothetical protein
VTDIAGDRFLSDRALGSCFALHRDFDANEGHRVMGRAEPPPQPGIPAVRAQPQE